MTPTPMVPNVWICLKKIRAYIEGLGRDDASDVLECITTMEKMFKDQPIGSSACTNGWPRRRR